MSKRLCVFVCVRVRESLSERLCVFVCMCVWRV